MNKNKIVSIMLITFLIVSSVGCSNKKSSKSNTGNSSNTGTAQTSDTVKNPSVQQPGPKFDKVITIGTPEADVKAMAGNFGSFIEHGTLHEYIYKTSHIYFSNVSGNYKIIGWNSLNENFKFSIGSPVSSAPPITLWSTRENVIKSAGTPVTYEIPYVQDLNTLEYTFDSNKSIYWRYADGSYVTFGANYQVIGWYNSGNLKISYGDRIDSSPPVRLGSTTQDILNAFGTPKRLSPWLPSISQKFIGYGNCTINLDENGIIDGWINNGSTMINMGSKDPSSKPFSIGSTMDDVLKAAGTPDRVTKLYTWSYGNSTVYFDNEWKVKKVANSGNLKFK